MQIILLKRGVIINSFKIKAYQDNILAFNSLSENKKLNLQYDSRVKQLINKENRFYILFPFDLYSVYLCIFDNEKILNSTNALRLKMGLSQAKPWLEKKFPLTISYKEVYWKSRQLVISLLSFGLQIWANKSFTNFMDTSHCLQQQGYLSSYMYRCY